MAKVSAQQNTFGAGEFSPLMFGRQDIDKYKSALQTCVNAIILLQGGWTRRPGTLRLNQTRVNGASASYLIPFTYSTIQEYMFEFGDSYIRFYSGHSLVTQTPLVVTNVSLGNPAVVTYTGADPSADDRVYISGVLGMTQVNNREFRVQNVGGGQFELHDQDNNPINSTGYDPYVSGGAAAVVLHLVSPYAAEDVPLIRFVQSADVIYLFHPDFPVYKLIRTAALSWTLTKITFIDGPYLPINATTTTLTPSAATGAGVTVTASAVTGINANNIGFQATDVGRQIRMKTGSTWGWMTITTVSSTTAIVGDIYTGPDTAGVTNTLTDTTAKVSWRLGLWSDTTGYPTNGMFCQDRLMLAGTPITPQRIDGSNSGIYETFAPSAASGAVGDGNSLSFTLNTKDVNPVYWMVNNVNAALLVGTGANEWQVRTDSLNSPLTPTNSNTGRMSSYGSASMAPVEAGIAVLYTQRAARKVREMAYVFQDNTFLSPDMTLLSEHISFPSIVKMVYQQMPQPIVWFLLSDGTFLSMTYARDQNVVAWCRHTLGGTSDGSGTHAVVEDIAVQVSPDATRDELWLTVKRYIGGQTVRSVEVMTKIWETTDDVLTSFYADYGWTQINGSPSTSVTGLFWAEGETFSSVLLDGAAHPPVTVTNGKVTLNWAATVVTLGYNYTSQGADMPDEAQSQTGSGQGMIKRIGRVGFWLLDILGFKYGPSFDKLTEQIVKKWGDKYGVATPLFTGVLRERLESDPDRIGNVVWQCDGPFPGTVLSLMTQTTVSDDS